MRLALLYCRNHPRTRGEKLLGRSGALSARDHPRTRGEKFTRGAKSGATEGSPPHTRGKAAPSLGSVLVLGITPAHAGKSERLRNVGGQLGDHPRTRGEKWNRSCSIRSFPGSPPHTRGKGGTCSRRVTADGITPAHAGKSCVCAA